MATCIWHGGYNGDYATDGNWHGGTAPGAGDTVIIRDSSRSIDSSLDQTGTTLAQFTVEMSFTGNLGTNTDYLQVDASQVDIGVSNELSTSAGGSMWKLDFGTVESDIRVHNTASAGSDAYTPPLLLKVNKNTTDIWVLDGRTGLAFFAGETTTIRDIAIGPSASGSTTTPIVKIGSGVTLADVVVHGGTSRCEAAGAAITLIQVRYGTLVVDTTATITELAIDGGTTYLDRCGTVTNANMNQHGGTLDLSRTQIPRTFTDMAFDGGVFKYDPASLTVTNNVSRPEKTCTLTIADLA